MIRYRRRWRAGGYLDFGPIQIPPQAVNLILTDRADGTLWHVRFSLDFDPGDGFGHISITDVLPTKNNRTYAAYEEPWLALIDDDYHTPPTRLIVRGGSLGVEVVDQPEGVQNAPLVARRDDLRRDYRIIIFSSEFPGEYAWTPLEIVQTPNP